MTYNSTAHPSHDDKDKKTPNVASDAQSPTSTLTNEQEAAATSAAVRILLIEDNVVQVHLLRHMLEANKAGQSSGLAQKFNVTSAGTVAEGIAKLSEGDTDLILLDLSLPDAHGLETLELVREQERDVPVVILTGMNDEELAVTAMQAGAQDYLVKDQINTQLLTRTIRYSIERHRLLRSLSLYDDLTGLYNRRGFITLAEQHLKLARRKGEHCILIYADLDGLKQINDAHGHHEGSAAIRYAAEILRDTFRQADIAARLGGDEFTVMLTDAPPMDTARLRARLQSNIDKFNRTGAQTFRLSLSVGIASFDPSSQVTLEELMNEADRLMYEQKRARYAKDEESA